MEDIFIYKTLKFSDLIDDNKISNNLSILDDINIINKDNIEIKFEQEFIDLNININKLVYVFYYNKCYYWEIREDFNKIIKLNGTRK